MANWWDSYMTDTPSYLDSNLTSSGGNWWDSIGANTDIQSPSLPSSGLTDYPSYGDSWSTNYDPNYLWSSSGDPSVTGPSYNWSAPPATAAADGSSTLSGILKALGIGGMGTSGSTGMTLADLLGKALPAGLGAMASSNQTDKLTALADKYSAMGQPYRDRLSALYADPSIFLNSDAVRVPVQQGTDMLARSLSTRGNPTGSGNALTELQKYSSGQLADRLGQEKDRLAGSGGLSSYSSAAPAAATNAIGSSANTYNAIGAGAADIFNPKPTNSLADLLKLMKG